MKYIKLILLIKTGFVIQSVPSLKHHGLHTHTQDQENKRTFCSLILRSTSFRSMVRLG